MSVLIIQRGCVIWHTLFYCVISWPAAQRSYGWIPRPGHGILHNTHMPASLGYRCV